VFTFAAVRLKPDTTYVELAYVVSAYASTMLGVP
jgi:hypothetical protein